MITSTSPARAPVEDAMIDAASLRDAFRLSNMIASQRAFWCSGYPSAKPNTCRYCGRHWRQWAGSKLDGHAACVRFTWRSKLRRLPVEIRRQTLGIDHRSSTEPRKSTAAAGGTP